MTQDIQKIDNDIIEATLDKARASPRKRAMHCFHRPDDRLQRMLNCGIRGTYVPPHMHKSKLEIFSILKGRVGICIFDDKGTVKEKLVLDQDGPLYAGEIAQGVLHCFIILSEEAAMFELIDGHYDADTHKSFPDWAPQEGDPAAEGYQKKLMALFD